MPRSTPPVLVPNVKPGALVAATAPDALGDIVPTGRKLLVVACGATGTTVSAKATAAGPTGTVPDGGGAVAANATRVFGPFPASVFAQPDDAAVGAGQVLVDYSSVATVTRYLIDA